MKTAHRLFRMCGIKIDFLQKLILLFQNHNEICYGKILADKYHHYCQINEHLNSQPVNVNCILMTTVKINRQVLHLVQISVAIQVTH